MTNISNSPAPGGIFSNGTNITPGTLDYNPPLTRLWIGVAGTLVATTAGNAVVVTLAAVPSGSWITDVAIINIGTATTCADIVGFW